MTALGMGNMMDVLVFDSLQSAFLTQVRQCWVPPTVVVGVVCTPARIGTVPEAAARQEYITIIDTSVSLDTVRMRCGGHRRLPFCCLRTHERIAFRTPCSSRTPAPRP